MEPLPPELAAAAVGILVAGLPEADRPAAARALLEVLGDAYRRDVGADPEWMRAIQKADGGAE
jgi:hypothetical protein